MKITDTPLGCWDQFGNWYPDLNLNMSVAEQRRHNIIGGHFNRVLPSEIQVKRPQNHEEKTLIQKIKGMFKK